MVGLKQPLVDEIAARQKVYNRIMVGLKHETPAGDTPCVSVYNRIMVGLKPPLSKI